MAQSAVPPGRGAGPAPPTTAAPAGRGAGPATQDFTFEVAPKEEQPEYTFEVEPEKKQDEPDKSGIPSWYRNIVQPVAEGAAAVTVGALKGATNTVRGVGKAVTQIPGVERGIDALYGQPGLTRNAFADMQQQVQPQGAAEKVGFYGEQVGELMAPGPKGSGIPAVDNLVAKGTAALGRVSPTAARVVPKMVAEGARSAAQADVQGGDPTTAGVIGGVAPAVGAVASKFAKPVATKLVEGAEKRMSQAMGPSKERFKAMAEKIIPKVLQRGDWMGRSREAILEKAAKNAEVLSDDIDTALQQFGSQPSKNPGRVMQAMENAKDAFRDVQTMSLPDAMKRGLVTIGAGRQAVTKPGAKILQNGQVEFTVLLDARPVQQLSKLQKVFSDLGPNPTVKQLVSLRRVWDGIVAQAGGYAHRAPGALGLPLREQTELWAKREGANEVRRLLAEEVPDLAAINKEFSYWKSLQDILTQTVKRTAPHGTSLGEAAAEATGAAIGTSHGIGAAYGLSKVAKMFKATVSSPQWRSASAQARYNLAQAIMSDDVSKIATALSRITANVASKSGGSGPTPPPARAAAGDAGGFEPVGDYEVRQVQ